MAQRGTGEQQRPAEEKDTERHVHRRRPCPWHVTERLLQPSTRSVDAVAERIYLDEVGPDRRADVVIDNTDLASPRIVVERPATGPT